MQRTVRGSTCTSATTGTPTGGTGFFKCYTIVQHVTYLCARPQSHHRATSNFAQVCIKVFGLEPEHDVYVASVYLSFTGCPREQYTQHFWTFRRMLSTTWPSHARYSWSRILLHEWAASRYMQSRQPCARLLPRKEK